MSNDAPRIDGLKLPDPPIELPAGLEDLRGVCSAGRATSHSFTDHLRRTSELASDLDDPDVMSSAWS